MTTPASTGLPDGTFDAIDAAPLGRLTLGEALTLVAIVVFAELLSLGWAAAFLGVPRGEATWGQALAVTAPDLVALLLIPLPLFAVYDRWPLTGARRTRSLAVRIAAAAATGFGQAALTNTLIRAGAPLVGLSSGQTRPLLAGPVEELCWGGLAAACASLAYYVLRRLRRARTLERRTAVLHAAAVEARLAALAAELRPHFLFNAMNDLAELVHHDPHRAEAMLLHLSSLLRGALTAGRAPLVPLADEFAHVDDYLALQGLRLGDRLCVTRDAPAELLGLRVPSMLLQPLVENAVLHGLEGRVGASRLHVAAAARPGTGGRGMLLELCVEDDGPGPGGAQAAESPESMSGASGRGTGTGLRNVRARLAALYGDAASLALTARPGGGTRATVRLPIVRGSAG